MKDKSTTWNFIFILVIFYALFSRIYYIFRFNGRWIEWDTGAWTKFIQAVYNQKTIIPTTGVYSNGYGYQVISTYLLSVTNLSVRSLQSLVYPVIGVVSVLVAYSLYLEFCGNKKVALLSAFLLCLSPDFLFRTSRGSHERFTFLFILLVIFILTRTFTLDRSKKDYLKNFVVYVLMFYVVVYALITINTFFASSFIIAVIFAFLFGYMISSKLPVYDFRRLIYTAATSIVFIFSNMFYIYSPARTLLNYADTIRDKAVLVGLSIADQPTPQYAYILYTWPSFHTYLFLTLFNWIIAPLSLIAYLRLVYDFIVKRKRLSSPLVLLLIFYTIFSLQLLLFIYTDRLGVFTHLELRIFPVLMFFAVPLAAIQVFNIIESPILKNNYRSIVKSLFVILFVVLAVNSVLKATMEPNITNEWMFYTNHEKIGLDWTYTYIKNEPIWAGLDDRLMATFNLNSDLGAHKAIDFTYSHAHAGFYFISSTIKKRAMKSRYFLPDLKDTSQVYDNGNVQIYKKG